jgi:hypothetical protein
VSYTTTPIANRLGLNRGWTNSLVPQNFYLTDTAKVAYLKSYLLLQEYLRFNKINLLTFETKLLTPYKKIIYLTVYQHLKDIRVKKRFANTSLRWIAPLLATKLYNYNKFVRKPVKVRKSLHKFLGSKLFLRVFVNNKYRKRIKRWWGEKSNRSQIQTKALYPVFGTKTHQPLRLLNSKASNMKLAVFVEAYVKEWFGFQCIIKFNRTSDNLYLGRVLNRLPRNNRKLNQIKEYKFFKRLLYVFMNFQQNMDAQLIVDLIAKEITLSKSALVFIHQVNIILEAIKPRFLYGYRIALSGKLKKRDLRASVRVVKFQGKDFVPVKQFNKRVLYALGVARTLKGVYGIKLWLYY